MGRPVGTGHIEPATVALNAFGAAGGGVPQGQPGLGWRPCTGLIAGAAAAAAAARLFGARLSASGRRGSRSSSFLPSWTVLAYETMR